MKCSRSPAYIRRVRVASICRTLHRNVPRQDYTAVIAVTMNEKTETTNRRSMAENMRDPSVNHAKQCIVREPDGTEHVVVGEGRAPLCHGTDNGDEKGPGRSSENPHLHRLWCTERYWSSWRGKMDLKVQNWSDWNAMFRFWRSPKIVLSRNIQS